ncbi:hypothetical protein SAMN04488065_1241 [Haloplanus vescus]|uniref:Uncharacterized protein n=1 Tax=Haloplanus vescus TaxID=555874 RepID=A0A1H3WYU7_9EURY|nr:hypothetical protein [Haloplanus vescus]SDZ92306.1 hypothetical protein SAMN04488065_1241 [Haloplanus vescus]
MSRGQLSLSLVEAAVGVVLVLGVTAGFALGTAAPTSATPRLDALAHDTTTVLGSDPVDDGQRARLVALARSESSFTRVQVSARERIRALLPVDVLFRVQTPVGSFGAPRPPTATVGSATASTRYGSVTVWVWYG